jgi:3',5'-cyclic AMP phosphodiesterase CpdA
MQYGARITLLALLRVASLHGAQANLEVHPDGTFKILAISDLHYGVAPESDSAALIDRLIALEKPDLVIVNGDNFTGDCCVTPGDVRKAAANVAAPMERAGVPWAVVLGNHDLEHTAKTRVTREQVFTYYEAYPHNVNGGWTRDLHGAGNKAILVKGKDGSTPAFAVWLLDSGPAAADPDDQYDWIHTDQVAWYFQASKELEARQGRKIPGLMFFHIPLPEFHEMAVTKGVLGERHEPESPSHINSGMFAAVVDRGDVMGIFCGHDHVNNYLGKFHGVWLGYVGTAGYHGYPHTPVGDVTNDHARGGRAFLIDESTPGRFQTWMRFRDGTTNWEHGSDAYEKSRIQ